MFMSGETFMMSLMLSFLDDPRCIHSHACVGARTHGHARTNASTAAGLRAVH
jgi:hypothetical protein